MIWFVRLAGFVLLLVTALPWLRSGKWAIRVWDFPRLQIALALVLVIAFAIILTVTQSRTSADRLAFIERYLWIGLMSLAFVWQVSHILPFSPLHPKEVQTSSELDPTIKLMVVNLNYENDNYQEVRRRIEAQEPDLLLLIEVDDEWHQQMDGLRDQFEFHHEEPRGEGLGMLLWSRLEIYQSETRFLVSDRRASIWATIRFPKRGVFQFVGVHPTPPGLKDSTGNSRRDSRVRDAELILVAKEISQRNLESWIVAGDFNDVAWSHTTRLFKRTSGLRDPRVGRSFIGTFHAEYPLLRFPIDHIFLSDGFTVGKLARSEVPGSDHFAMLATVSLQSPDEGVTPVPQGDDEDDAQQMIEEGLKDAEKRDVR